MRPATALLGSTAAIGTETSNTCVAIILPLLRIFADNATLAEAVGAATMRKARTSVISCSVSFVPVDGPADGLKIVGVFKAFDQLGLHEHGEIVAPLRVVDGGAVAVVVAR